MHSLNVIHAYLHDIPYPIPATPPSHLAMIPFPVQRFISHNLFRGDRHTDGQTHKTESPPYHMREKKFHNPIPPKFLPFHEVEFRELFPACVKLPSLQFDLIRLNLTKLFTSPIQRFRWKKCHFGTENVVEMFRHIREAHLRPST